MQWFHKFKRGVELLKIFLGFPQMIWWIWEKKLQRYVSLKWKFNWWGLASLVPFMELLKQSQFVVGYWSNDNKVQSLITTTMHSIDNDISCLYPSMSILIIQLIACCKHQNPQPFVTASNLAKTFDHWQK